MAIATFPSDSNQVKGSVDRRKVGTKKPQPALIKNYLIAYNVASCLAWGAVLFLLVSHFIDPAATPTATKGGAWSKLQSVLANIIPSNAPKHKAAAVVKSRLAGGYAAVGPLTAVVQTAAVLEVVHAALGWVRSPVGTTAAQVASRLWSVWAVVEHFETARTSPAYSTMVFAWSLTEVVRYLFYALSLLNVSVPFLNWLRYSTFIPLYPLGAGSEAYISYLTLPPLANLPVVGSYVAQVQKALGLKSVAFLAGKLGKSWSAFDLARGGLVFVIWPPALYVLYTYMISQRKKALGGGRKVGQQKKKI